MILRWCAESLDNSQHFQAFSNISSLKCLLWLHKGPNREFHSSRITSDSLSHIHILIPLREGGSAALLWRVGTAHLSSSRLVSHCRGDSYRYDNIKYICSYGVTQRILNTQCSVVSTDAQTMCCLLNVILEDIIYIKVFKIHPTNEYSVMICWPFSFGHEKQFILGRKWAALFMYQK